MSDRLTDFRQLNVWQKAHSLVLDVFGITKKYPKEGGDIVPHLRRAAATIPIKIAEGFIRRSPKEKENAYKQGQAALEEVRYYILLSDELGYLKDTTAILESVGEVGRMLTGLVRSARN